MCDRNPQPPSHDRCPGNTKGLAAALVLILALAACMQHYGSFALDKAVGDDFRSGIIRSEYQYFYAGRDTMPYAIMAIDRKYNVPSRLWVPFDAQPAVLGKMSRNIYQEVQKAPYGAYIKAPDGKIIGLWLSNVFARSVRMDPQQGTVEVLFVNPEIDDRGDW